MRVCRIQGGNAYRARARRRVLSIRPRLVSLDGWNEDGEEPAAEPIPSRPRQVYVAYIAFDEEGAAPTTFRDVEVQKRIVVAVENREIECAHGA